MGSLHFRYVGPQDFELLRVWHRRSHVLEWWPDEHDPGVRGIDQFLASPEQLDRGIGTRLIRDFVSMLFEDSRVTRVQVDPEPRNARAIRCYEKVGFRTVREIVTPDGSAVLMYMDSPES
jgi:RimJ/RimL family protein N-acetyltransferase